MHIDGVSPASVYQDEPTSGDASPFAPTEAFSTLQQRLQRPFAALLVGIRAPALQPRVQLRNGDLVQMTLLPNDFDVEMRVAVDLDIYDAHPATAGWPGRFC